MTGPNPLLQLPGMSAHRHRVEDALRGSVAAEDELMAEMAGHLITAGGKRVRPLFCVAAAAASAADAGAVDGLVTDDAILGGVSVELVHLGSLYHDDVIDEATTRRTVESVNARWGNLKAILAGDFLLAKASEIAASLGTEVARLLAATIGRLCEGEVRELRRMYDTARTEDDYLAAIEGKTASLFGTACRIGGIVGEVAGDDLERLTTFGVQYGMAFQIVDDVLDVVASEAQLGKPAGLDMAEGVYTVPVIRTLARPAGDELRELLGGPISGEQVARARHIVEASGAVEEAIALAGSYVDGAVEAIAPLGDRPAVIALAGSARHLLTDLDAVRVA